MDKNDFLAINAIRNSPELKEYLTKQLELWEKQIIDETRQATLKELGELDKKFAHDNVYHGYADDTPNPVQCRTCKIIAKLLKGEMP